MSARCRFRVGAEEAGRVDKILASRWPDAPRAEIARLFSRGDVRLDGAVAAKGARAAAGAEIELARPPPGPEDRRPIPEPDFELSILYEDDDVVAANKPAGAPSHPLRAGERGSAAGGLVARYPELARSARDPREGGLAHRLDTHTSGVLLAARSRRAWEGLRASLGAGGALKLYDALVAGPLPARGASRLPLAQRGGRARVDHRAGLPAATAWRELARADNYALVRCAARTGRMHQIRAHLAAAGAPIVGDATYGGEPGDPLGLAGPFLHARALAIPHPRTGAPLEIAAPLPQERARALARAGLAGAGDGDPFAEPAGAASSAGPAADLASDLPAAPAPDPQAASSASPHSTKRRRARR